MIIEFGPLAQALYDSLGESVCNSPEKVHCLPFGLGLEIIIPPHFDLMGAIGAAKLARRAGPSETLFKGLEVAHWHFSTRSFECDGCGNTCDVMELIAEGEAVACWGDTCGRYSDTFNGTHEEGRSSVGSNHG